VREMVSSVFESKSLPGADSAVSRWYFVRIRGQLSLAEDFSGSMRDAEIRFYMFFLVFWMQCLACSGSSPLSILWLKELYITSRKEFDISGE